jgi:hypothetical protein
MDRLGTWNILQMRPNNVYFDVTLTRTTLHLMFGVRL